MAKQWTRIKFELPFVIPVDDGVYEVLVSGGKSRVSIQRVQRTLTAGLFTFGSGVADLKYDTHGRLAFSKVSIEIPGHFEMTTRHDKFFDSDRLTIIEKAIDHLNRLVDVSRHVTGNFSVGRVRYPDTLGFEISYLSDGKETPGAVGMSTGTGGVVMSGGPIRYLTGDQREKLIRSLQEEEKLDPSISFLLDAKSSILDEDYALATVLAVVVLEVALSRFAMERGKKKGIEADQIERMVKEIGIRISIDGFLKLLLDPSDPTLDDKILESCSGAITTRNNVVHKGIRFVTREETEERILAIEKMANYLASLNAR